jgi:hypothetical protein
MMGGVSPDNVEQLRNIGIINYTTRPHLVGSFYVIFITMHGSDDIKKIICCKRAFPHFMYDVIIFLDTFTTDLQSIIIGRPQKNQIYIAFDGYVYIIETLFCLTC